MATDKSAPSAAARSGKAGDAKSKSGKAALSELEVKQKQMMAKLVAASFGEVVTLMMRTPRYRKMPIETLEATAAAPVALGQVAIAEAQSKETGAVMPIAVVLWARVSSEVDRRLSDTENETTALNINEWRSGNIPWIIEAIGERKALGKLLHQLVTTVFKTTPPKMRTTGADGKPTVGRLERVDKQDGKAKAKV
ncbi:MAG: toxin-activating lysine-acyltransferase [Hyphomicrobium sp.]